MVHDPRMTVPVGIGNDIVHDIAQRQRHFVRLSLSQHFAQIALRVYIHQQNTLAVHSQSSAKIIHGGTFFDAALLIGNRNHLLISACGCPIF